MRERDPREVVDVAAPARTDEANRDRVGLGARIARVLVPNLVACSTLPVERLARDESSASWVLAYEPLRELEGEDAVRARRRLVVREGRLAERVLEAQHHADLL